MLNDQLLAYRVPVAARLIGISRSKMWTLIADRKIATRKIGGATIILRADLQEFLAKMPASNF
ncbi:helix-turn-helix domain-containing protein [Methylobacterium phyllosphaerae]